MLVLPLRMASRSAPQSGGLPTGVGLQGRQDAYHDECVWRREYGKGVGCGEKEGEWKGGRKWRRIRKDGDGARRSSRRAAMFR
jgi:hypothetical protein